MKKIEAEFRLESDSAMAQSRGSVRELAVQMIAHCEANKDTGKWTVIDVKTRPRSNYLRKIVLGIAGSFIDVTARGSETWARMKDL